jgi:hypothetical protein
MYCIVLYGIFVQTIIPRAMVWQNIETRIWSRLSKRPLGRTNIVGTARLSKFFGLTRAHVKELPERTHLG